MAVAASALNPVAGASGPSALRELASGVDALYMSGRGEVSPALLTDLAAARSRAEEAGEAVAFDLGGCSALVEPRPLGRYRFRLSTEHGLIGITPTTKLPPLRIQPRSEHLHAVGPTASVQWFEDLAGSFTHGLRLHASRLDVFSDWHGLELSVESRANFVGRAQHLRTNERNGQFTGFEFGRRRTGTITARIYDKVVDVRRTGKDWWFDKWGGAYEPGRQVLRAEFEFGRKGLVEYGVDTAADALEAAPGLYLTAATDWLSLRTPTGDDTRSRWPVSEAWRVVQRPSFAEGAVGLDRVRDRLIAASMRRIVPCLVGYLVAFAALSGHGTLEEALPDLLAAVRGYEARSGRSFSGRVAGRRLALGWS